MSYPLEVIYYKTSDGKVFENKVNAEKRQAILNNPNEKICPSCDGEGKKDESEGWHCVANIVDCRTCHGKGYLEKTTVWA